MPEKADIRNADKRDPSVRLALRVIFSLAIWVVSIIVANVVLNRHPASPVVRGAMVVLAVCGFVAWITAAAKAILGQDEFSQRLHFLAAGCAFALSTVVIFAADFLQRAGFLDDLSLTTIWILMFGTWWVSILVAGWLYR